MEDISVIKEQISDAIINVESILIGLEEMA